MSIVADYFNLMENKVGLGPTGTHLVHGGVVGGATWAAGKYGGLEFISDNWWAPFVGAVAGIGLSATARWMVVTDEVKAEWLLERAEKEMAKMVVSQETKERWEILAQEIRVSEAVSKADPSKARQKAAR